jgi:hypothetical protein
MPSIYERPLNERLEAASKAFATTYSRKARLARASRRRYSNSEFNRDLYRVAGDYGLFAEALWAYFRLLYPLERFLRARGVLRFSDKM